MLWLKKILKKMLNVMIKKKKEYPYNYMKLKKVSCNLLKFKIASKDEKEIQAPP